MDQEKKRWLNKIKSCLQAKVLFSFYNIFIFSGCGLKQESLSINHYGIDFKTQKSWGFKIKINFNWRGKCK